MLSVAVAVPLTFVIGAGASVNWPSGAPYERPLWPALDGFVGVRMREDVAIGAHGRFTAMEWGWGDSAPRLMGSRHVQMFDVGPALQLDYGRWSFEGWLGVHTTRSSLMTEQWSDNDPDGPPVTVDRDERSVLAACGVLAGVALVEDGYRPSVYVELQSSITDLDEVPYKYTALTLGVALRY